MNVAEVIEMLQEIEDKTLPVFVMNRAEDLSEAYRTETVFQRGRLWLASEEVDVLVDDEEIGEVKKGIRIY